MKRLLAFILAAFFSWAITSPAWAAVIKVPTAVGNGATLTGVGAGGIGGRLLVIPTVGVPVLSPAINPTITPAPPINCWVVGMVPNSKKASKMAATGLSVKTME